jgi:hypothetical protein
MSQTTRVLLRLLDEAFDRRAWHGPNLRGSIRGLSAAAAARRPAPRRHNIWELVVHAAYWKYAVRRRLTGEKRGSFPLAGSNWFPRPTGGRADERAWRRDIGLLVEMHGQLREAVERFPEGEWSRRGGTGAFDNVSLVAGAAAHDLYHAGQIQLLKRFGR